MNFVILLPIYFILAVSSKVFLLKCPYLNLISKKGYQGSSLLKSAISFITYNPHYKVLLWITFPGLAFCGS